MVLLERRRAGPRVLAAGVNQCPPGRAPAGNIIPAVGSEFGQPQTAPPRCTRLESMIQRVVAQCTLIDRAVELVGRISGPVLELGLGNGRTYDHLRNRFQEREVFVFDRELASHPDSRPDAPHFIQGDFRETLPKALAIIGSGAAVAHCDVGSHDAQASRALAATIAPLLGALMTHGGIVLADQPMSHPEFRALPLPDDLEPLSYFAYRVDKLAVDRP